MDEYKDLAVSTAMVVIGTMGLYRRRGTMAKLYLDARVFWNKHFGAPRKKSIKQQEEEENAERVTRLRDGDDGDIDDGEAAIDLKTYMDEDSGVTVHSWMHVDGKRMVAVGDGAPFPTNLDESLTYHRAACPFVMLTYINDEGDECTVDVDTRLWYTICPPKKESAAASSSSVPKDEMQQQQHTGVPKFTRDEVMFLVGKSYPDVQRIWTDEYVLECTTADGRDVVLRNDQVMWTAAVPKVVADDNDNNDDNDDHHGGIEDIDYNNSSFLEEEEANDMVLVDDLQEMEGGAEETAPEEVEEMHDDDDHEDRRVEQQQQQQDDGEEKVDDEEPPSSSLVKRGASDSDDDDYQEDGGGDRPKKRRSSPKE